MTDLVAKNLTVIVSVGNVDRDHTVEELQAAIRKAIPAKFNLTFASAHYVIDGKVCLPRDYDPAAQDFKPGAVPPPWAGGPKTVDVVAAPSTAETKPLSPREALGLVPAPTRRVVTRPQPSPQPVERPGRRVVRRPSSD